jgi:hypothetical protein
MASNSCSSLSDIPVVYCDERGDFGGGAAG